MEAKIQKWGNSLAVRIPKAFVKEAHVEYGSVVDLSLEDGKIVIDPKVQPEYSLKDLLKDVRKGNLHSEVSTGHAAGREIW